MVQTHIPQDVLFVFVVDRISVNSWNECCLAMSVIGGTDKGNGRGQSKSIRQKINLSM